jgi:hypothetical protein
MNFPKQPLVCKEFFELKHIHEEQKQTNKYNEFQKFIHLYERYKTRKYSTLTLRLNSKTGEMFFLLILHQLNIYVM